MSDGSGRNADMPDGGRNAHMPDGGRNADMPDAHLRDRHTGPTSDRGAIYAAYGSYRGTVYAAHGAPNRGNSRAIAEQGGS